MVSPATNGANTFLPPSPVIPMFLNIISVTNTNPMIVTVNTPNTWVAGQVARFSIPYSYGMTQLNGLSGEISHVDPTNLIFSVGINSIQFDVFKIPTGGEQPATMAPAGSRNLYNINTVPFHSEGDFGN